MRLKPWKYEPVGPDRLEAQPLEPRGDELRGQVVLGGRGQSATEPIAGQEEQVGLHVPLADRIVPGCASAPPSPGQQCGQHRRDRDQECSARDPLLRYLERVVFRAPDCDPVEREHTIVRIPNLEMQIMRTTRVAAVSMNGFLGEPERVLRAIDGWCEQAAAEKAELVLFPELVIHGHCTPNTWELAEPVPDGPERRTADATSPSAIAWSSAPA